MVVARASGMDLASSLKRNTFLTLGVGPAGGGHPPYIRSPADGVWADGGSPRGCERELLGRSRGSRLRRDKSLTCISLQTRRQVHPRVSTVCPWSPWDHSGARRGLSVGENE